MNINQFKTDLTCESCVATLDSVFKKHPEIQSWNVDLKSPDKILTVQGSLSESKIIQLVQEAGYRATHSSAPITEATEVPLPTDSKIKTYYPLILIFAYLTGFSLLKQITAAEFSAHESMMDFMGGFFVVFSFFKFLNLKGFANAYATYDVIAKRSRPYAFLYPFLELILGIAYLIRFDVQLTSAFTLVLMLVSSIGVVQAVLKKSQIQCACLGTIFKLPMTYVTLFEDLLMAGMAVLALVK
jgi:copper chaperone CopZ